MSRVEIESITEDGGCLFIERVDSNDHLSNEDKFMDLWVSSQPKEKVFSFDIAMRVSDGGCELFRGSIGDIGYAKCTTALQQVSSVTNEEMDMDVSSIPFFSGPPPLDEKPQEIFYGEQKAKPKPTEKYEEVPKNSPSSSFKNISEEDVTCMESGSFNEDKYDDSVSDIPELPGDEKVWQLVGEDSKMKPSMRPVVKNRRKKKKKKKPSMRPVLKKKSKKEKLLEERNRRREKGGVKKRKRKKKKKKVKTVETFKAVPCGEYSGDDHVPDSCKLSDLTLDIPLKIFDRGKMNVQKRKNYKLFAQKNRNVIFQFEAPGTISKVLINRGGQIWHSWPVRLPAIRPDGSAARFLAVRVRAEFAQDFKDKTKHPSFKWEHLATTGFDFDLRNLDKPFGTVGDDAFFGDLGSYDTKNHVMRCVDPVRDKHRDFILCYDTKYPLSYVPIEGVLNMHLRMFCPVQSFKKRFRARTKRGLAQLVFRSHVELYLVWPGVNNKCKRKVLEYTYNWRVSGNSGSGEKFQCNKNHSIKCITFEY